MSIIHEELRPHSHGERVRIGPMLSQPYCVFDVAGGSSAYVNIGSLSQWTDACDTEYATGLAGLLKRYDAVLVIDDMDGSLLVEIQHEHAERIALAFLDDYHALFTPRPYHEYDPWPW